jgi:hypothetical protein
MADIFPLRLCWYIFYSSPSTKSGKISDGAKSKMAKLEVATITMRIPSTKKGEVLKQLD